MSDYHTIHLFINNKPFTSWQSYAFRTNGGRPSITRHRAYFCSHCGEIWAREYIQQHPDWPEPIWLIDEQNCVEHGDGLLLPPIFYTDPDMSIEYDGITKELLARDFLILMNREEI